jgi:membrane protein
VTSEASEPKTGAREPMPSVMHPRGRIAPPLADDAPPARRLLRALFRLGQGLYFHDAFRNAPAMAFHFFLSLMPLLVFLGWVVAQLLQQKGIETVLTPFLESLPVATEAIVEREARRLASADTLGPLAAFGFFWIASGGTHGLMVAVEAVVGAPRRPWWKQRLIALAWVLATLVAVAGASFGVIQWDDVFHHDAESSATVSAPASSFAPAAASAPPSTPATSTVAPTGRRRLEKQPPRVRRPMRIFRSDGERALALVLSLAGAIAGLAAFYRLSVSHLRRVKRRVFPGAVLAVGLWLVISWGFGLYVRTLTNYAVFYGSLAAVAVLLVWLWLVSLAILVGAELNAQLEGLRD